MSSFSMLPYNSHKESVSCRLPSIHSLLLDLPAFGLLPPLYQNKGLLAPPLLPATAGSQGVVPSLNGLMAVNLGDHYPATYLPQPQRGTGLNRYPGNTLISPLSSPHSRSGSNCSNDMGSISSSFSDKSSNRTRSSSDPFTSTYEPVNLNLNQASNPQIKIQTDIKSSKGDNNLQIDYNTSDEGESFSGERSRKDKRKASWKPRRKRKCPECNMLFSNLATHKSTHLNPTSRPHVCKYCNRGFARPNDLFRHTKSHWKEIGSDKGQFKCPFKNTTGQDHCCHDSGIFSRCDTYKNHLKAIHFQYPNGTKKDQRNEVSGQCKLCNQHFSNVDAWLLSHIETNSCPYARDQ